MASIFYVGRLKRSDKDGYGRVYESEHANTTTFLLNCDYDQLRPGSRLAGGYEPVSLDEEEKPQYP